MSASKEDLLLWSRIHWPSIDLRPPELVQMTNAAKTTENYNHFLYLLTRHFKPTLMVETGTDRGRSAAHMARGNPTGNVVTIDIDPACSAQAMALGLANVTAWTGESLDLVNRFMDRSIDLLFLDSLHTYEHTKAEWLAFQPKLRRNALVLIDDVALDAGMAQFWDELPEPKLALNHLHFSGFGAWWPA